MKAVLLSPRKGHVTVGELPPPVTAPGMVIIRNEYSLISAGTERATVATGRQGLVGKARHRPDQVKLVLDTVRSMGVIETYRMVQDRLDRPTMLGYSCAGTVLAVGEGVHDLGPGMRVAAAGAGYASHAEVIAVPRNLVVPVPDTVDSRWAAFATVGAIALHGIHQADSVAGSRVAVIGLGLVGQLTLHLLRAYGYDAVGIDSDPAMVTLAREAGLAAFARDTGELPSVLTRRWSNREADAVIITAATKSTDPVELAGTLARDRASVVIVGDVAVAPPRGSYYHKELSIRYSRSYGPGRYDPLFEEGGEDYPEGYVPWTERRNLAEIIRLVDSGALDPSALQPLDFPLDEASAAYARLQSGEHERRIALLLKYPGTAALPPVEETTLRSGRMWTSPVTKVRIAAVGAGNFVTRMLFPTLKRESRVEFSWIASGRGLSATHQGQRWGFRAVADSVESGLASLDADCVLVVSRHDSHGCYASKVLDLGMALFCEKPLALTEDDLELIAAARRRSGAPAMVGFNRRFSPAIRDLKASLPADAPLQLVYRVFAGQLPPDHWYFEPRQGGRLLGEVCHFVDTAGYLVGSRPVRVSAIGVDAGDPVKAQDVTLLLTYANGSTASITYGGRTPPCAPKESIEVAGDGIAARINDFGSLHVWKSGDAKETTYRGKPKGHVEEMTALVQLVRGEDVPEASFELALWSSLATCRAARALECGGSAPIAPATEALAAALNIAPRAANETLDET